MLGMKKMQNRMEITPQAAMLQKYILVSKNPSA
jgi:hypothetical protein